MACFYFPPRDICIVCLSVGLYPFFSRLFHACLFIQNVEGKKPIVFQGSPKAPNDATSSDLCLFFSKNFASQQRLFLLITIQGKLITKLQVINL